MEKLEWYVIIYDFNKKELEDFNIFNSTKFSEGIKDILENDNYTSFEDFCEKLDKELMYTFWSKAEYEVIISDMFDTIERKIDVYRQVKSNIEVLAEYILNNYNY